MWGAKYDRPCLYLISGDTDILQEQGKEEPVEMLDECSTEKLNGGI